MALYENHLFLYVFCRLSATSHSLTPQSDLDSSSSEEFYQAVHHAEQTFRKMESYLKQQQLCDVILIVGNRKIPAHRYSNLSILEIWIHMFRSDSLVCRLQNTLWLENSKSIFLRKLGYFSFTFVYFFWGKNCNAILSKLFKK